MTTATSLRRAGRVGTAVLTLSLVLLAQPAFAGTPVTWSDPEPMSVLKALLIYGGIPLALMLGITLLVLAPSLVRGDRQQRGVTSWTEPEWFGGPGDAVPAGRHAARGELESGDRERAGGASARW